jgi:uncharacterized protein (DUF58 family)
VRGLPRGAQLTRRAWTLLVAGVGLPVVGRLLGVRELTSLGLVALVLTAASVALVAYGPVEIEAVRRLVPARVHAGTACRVDLHVRNIGLRRSPVLTARDPFDLGRRWARFRLAPLAAGQGCTAAYRVPTDRRGLFELGPLQLIRTDPLGLVTRTIELGGRDTVTVYPRIDQIAALPHTRGADPRGGTVTQAAFGASGDEFHALRPYVVGDDLRRVHWKSSARSEDLLIRQDDLPWQGRATVVVDLRASVHTEASFEAAMSAAASIASACIAAGLELRLIGTDGVDTGHGAGRSHLDTILERLAAWDPDPSPAHDLTRSLAGVAQARDSTLATITTGRAGPVAVAAAARARRSRRGAVVVVLEDQAGPGHPAPAGATVVRCPAANGFAAAWAATIGPVRVLT